MPKARTEPKLQKLPAVFTAQPGAVLVYSNRSSAPMLIDVSTREKMDAGLKYLFSYLDTEWGVYSDLAHAPGEERLQSEMAELRTAISKAESKIVALALQSRLSGLNAEHQKASQSGLQRKREFYAKAKGGDVKAIAELLRARRSYEYEGWRILTMIDPIAAQAPASTEAGAPPETRQETNENENVAVAS